jgi:salicylate hydroxylase
MSAHEPFLVAGGGIAGLALALALARKGLRSTVLEKRAGFGTAGAGIQLGPNGVRALQNLGIAERLRPLVGEPESICVRDGASGRVLAELPLGAWIAARHGTPYWTLHRADLHAALADAASNEPLIELRAGTEVLGFSAARNSVLAATDTHKFLTGRALIGADGLWSRVRKHIWPSTVPRFAGAVAARCLLASSDARELDLRAVNLWLSPAAHVVHYPVRGRSELAVVIIARDDREVSEWENVADPSSVQRHLAGCHPPLRDTLSGVTEWRNWALYRLSPLPRWSEGRVTLMGDAAHPMLPYLAQGGVLALEDAIVLASRLALHAGDDPGAFSAFEARQKRRAHRIQVASQRNGRIYHLAPPLSGIRDIGFRVLPGAWLMQTYDWLYKPRALDEPV